MIPVRTQEVPSNHGPCTQKQGRKLLKTKTHLCVTDSTEQAKLKAKEVQSKENILKEHFGRKLNKKAKTGVLERH